MTLRIPEDRDEVFNQLSADVKNNLPNSNPQKEKSWIKSILVAFAGAFFDLYFQILEAIDTFFSNTTFGVFLEQKAANYGITRGESTQSSGSMTIGGVAGTSIPIGTAFTNQDGSQYLTTEGKTIVTEIDSVALMTFSAGVVTVTTVSENKLINALSITVAGVTSPAGLNGAFEIASVINANTFTYEAPIVGSGTAVGTITVESTKAVIAAESTGTGLDKNMSLNEQITLSTPISGVNNAGAANSDTISGASDEESDEDLRERLIFRLQNPVTLFNVAQITIIAREFTFVEKVFVQRITPAVGQVTVYLLKEDNTLPTPSELTQVKDGIVVAILPAHMSESDLFVLAPTIITTDFELTAIIPDTDTMKQSIQNRLIEFFNTQPGVGETITEDQYRCVIQATIDSETGETLQDFTLNLPVGDIVINTGELAALGTVNFV